MYYGPYILRDAGYGGESNKSLLIVTLPLSFFASVGAVIGIFLTEKSGRRGGMLCILPVIGLSMVSLSSAMYMIHFQEMTSIGAIMA